MDLKGTASKIRTFYQKSAVLDKDFLKIKN